MELIQIPKMEIQAETFLIDNSDDLIFMIDKTLGSQASKLMQRYEVTNEENDSLWKENEKLEKENYELREENINLEYQIEILKEQNKKLNMQLLNEYNNKIFIFERKLNYGS